MACLFISNDLFSSSQFASAIRQGGIDVTAALAIPARVAAEMSVVVLDLETPGAVESIPALKSGGQKLIAFGPHVKIGLLEGAQQGGADYVLTRGQATRDLGPLVARLLPPQPPGTNQ